MFPIWADGYAAAANRAMRFINYRPRPTCQLQSEADSTCSACITATAAGDSPACSSKPPRSTPLRPHGVSNARLSAPYLQACSQAPQNAASIPEVHGREPPSPTTRTRSSQALMQSSQRRQASTKFPTDQGGRSEPGPVSRLPRRNARRDKLILFMVVAPKAIKARPQRSLQYGAHRTDRCGSLRHGRKHGGGVRRHMRANLS